MENLALIFVITQTLFGAFNIYYVFASTNNKDIVHHLSSQIINLTNTNDRLASQIHELHKEIK